MTQNISVPLSLHPASVEKFYVRGPSGERVADPTLAGLTAAMKSARELAEATAAMAIAAMKDATQPEAARRIAIRNRSISVIDKAAAVLDKARDAALSEIARIERETATPGLRSELHAEIRASLAKMPKSDRGKTLSDADDTVLSAVLGDAPAFLSGMTSTEVEMVRATFRNRKFPKETERVDRLRRANAALTRGGEALMGFLQSLASDPAALLAETEAKAAKDAQVALEERAA